MKSLLSILFILASSVSYSQTDSLAIKWGGYVDTYFMYDFNNLPRNQASHPFTTPSRHNEFNINLAHIEVRASSQNVHGALALHSGTAVRTNYAAEIDNRELSQFIHEAWAGYQVANGLWIDAGIYPAPYGFESWMTKDNKTYSPSLVTNFSPFYQTGIRATWQVSDPLYVQIHIINGWQNIAETNNDKAVGISFGYVPTGILSVSYNNFIGNEQPVGTPSAIRFYNNLCTRLTLNKDLQFDMTTDYGIQKMKDINASWFGAALIGRYKISSIIAIAARTEYYKDENQVIYTTGTKDGFDGLGASANVDFQLSPALLWRTEGRIIISNSKVFNSADGPTDKSAFIVTSLAFTMTSP
jgi:hypothetical protein